MDVFMTTMELLCHVLGINTYTLSKKEVFLLEAELLMQVCDELKEIFKEQSKDYFHMLKLTTEKENAMLEDNFISLVLKDILSTEEYTINGIAYYLDTHEDIIFDVINGKNSNPSATLLRKSINLHRSVRRDLYQAIMKKIVYKTSGEN